MIELERLMQNLYEDKCTGTIPQTVFQTLMQKYETERAEKASPPPHRRRSRAERGRNRKETNWWREVIRPYTKIRVREKSILLERGDRIEGGERRGRSTDSASGDKKVSPSPGGGGDDARAGGGRR